MADEKERARQSQPEERQDPMGETEIDTNLVETFPASDPPSWTVGTDHKDKSPPQEEDAKQKS